MSVEPRFAVARVFLDAPTTPKPKTVTRRRSLANDLRQLLAGYARDAAMGEPSKTREIELRTALSGILELLELEGVDVPGVEP